MTRTWNLPLNSKQFLHCCNGVCLEESNFGSFSGVWSMSLCIPFSPEVSVYLDRWIPEYPFKPLCIPEYFCTPLNVPTYPHTPRNIPTYLYTPLNIPTYRYISLSIATGIMIMKCLGLCFCAPAWSKWRTTSVFSLLGRGLGLWGQDFRAQDWVWG